MLLFPRGLAWKSQVGGVPERSNGMVSKTIISERVSEVRILPPPPVGKMQMRVARLAAQSAARNERAGKKDSGAKIPNCQKT